MSDALEVQIIHRYSGSEAHIDAAFRAPPGVTALFGPSGAGKTSIVNAVAGLLRPDAGRIAVGDRVLFDAEARCDVPRHARDAGYVFQDARLFPHLDVMRNLRFGMRFARAGEAMSFDAVVGQLGIEHLMDRYPATLSGGEAQRVAIGRALLSGPRVLLLDEPLAALDEARKAELLPLLAALARDAGLPILYVSHAVPEVVRLATTVVVLDAGRVVRTGPVEDILSDAAAPDALGARTGGGLLNATVRVRHLADGLTEVATGGGPLFLTGVTAGIGTSIRVRVSAHDVILAREKPEGLSALNVLQAHVERLGEAQGSDRMIALRVGGDRLAVRITARSARILGLTEGSPCFAIIKVTGIEAGGILEAL